MVIMASSGEISLSSADPPDVTRYVTCDVFPSGITPSHVPTIVLSLSKAFCESDCPKAAVAAKITTTIANRVACFVIVLSPCPCPGSTRQNYPGVLFRVTFGSFKLARWRRFFWSRLLRIFRFDKSFQARQAGLPEHAIFFQPGIYGSQRFRVQAIEPMTPPALLLH